MADIKLIVFDMAGTIVDEDNVVYKTIHKSILDAGYDVSLEKVLLHGAGKEKHQAIKDIVADYSFENVDTEAIFSAFKNNLDLAYENLVVSSFEGMDGLLATLKERDIKVAFDTGYSRKIATLLLNKLGWKEGKEYLTLITADDVVNGRPHPDMIRLAMERTGISDPASVLKAGDSAIDIEEGKNAGCGVTVGVTSGAQTAEQLAEANPTFILGSVVEIPEYI